MKRLNGILLILLCIEKTNLELRLTEVNQPSTLPDFTIQVLTNYTGAVRKMAVFFSDHFLEVSKIIQGVNIPVTVNAEETPILQGLNKREPCEIVLMLEEPSNFFRCLNTTLWTSDTIFILIVRDSSFSEEILLEVFQEFFAVNVLNVFIFVSEFQKVFIYTYRPFVLSRCNSFEVFLVNAESKSFALKNQVDDLHECLVNVSVVDLPPMAIFPDKQSKNGTFRLEGTEASIIHEVSKKLNFVPHFAVAKDGEAWGWIHPSPHGVVGEVFLKRSHFGFGLLATALERYERLDMTVPVSPLRECITWAVPSGAAKSRALWIEIYVHEFSVVMWIWIAFVFILTAAVFWRISKAFRVHWESVLMYLFAAFISVPVKVPKVMPLRYLFLSWIWYSFIIMISYQALVGSKLTVPFHQRDIETIRDLLDTKLRLTGFYNTFRLITYEAEGDLQKVASRLEATTFGMQEAIHYIVHDRNIAYLREATSFRFFVISNPQAKGQVHFMKECAYQYYPIMVLQKGSYFTERTNHIISRLFESGILMKWRRRYIYLLPRTPSPGIRLTLGHMLAPFVALCVGISSSIVVFITEQVLHRCCRKTEIKLQREHIPHSPVSSGSFAMKSAREQQHWTGP